MANIILTGKFYPVSMMRYTAFALEKMGHKLWRAGPFFETLPWRPDRDYQEYLDIPDLELPDVGVFPAAYVLNNCPFKPDLLLSFDAGFSLIGAKDTGITNAIVLTDPHALPQEYADSVNQYDKVFIMQWCYRTAYLTNPNGNPRAIWWYPYGADTDRHYWAGTDFTGREYDVCIVSGLLYPQRLSALMAFHEAGLNVFQDSGLLFEQATEQYNKSIVAFNWSSQRDLPARFWEGLATRNLVLTNRVPDLQEFPDLQDGVHYVGYDTLEECVEKAIYYSKHRDAAWEIASRGYGQFYAGNHSWLQRASLLLDACEVRN